MNANPEPYDEKRRLAEIIGDARKFLAGDGRPASLGAQLGRAEALLKMLADSAEVFTPYQAPGTGSAR